MVGDVSVLFVSVSVVARPTSVSVDVGSVSVPVFVIVEITGAESVGAVANTAAPVPVSSVSAPRRFALEGVARNVATPEPRPDIAVLIGTFVSVFVAPLMLLFVNVVVLDGVTLPALAST